MARMAVIVVDMLNDFVTGSVAAPAAQLVIEPIRRLIEAARDNGVPVIYSNDAHRAGIDAELTVWGDHAIEGTKGAEVVEELRPGQKDYVVPKRRDSGFYGTDMDALLRELKVDTLVLTGLHANMCIRHTAADAFFRGYAIEVPSDAVQALTEAEYVEGLDYLKRIYGAKIVTVAEAINEFQQEGSAEHQGSGSKGQE
jgi:nicotinamidase-related amidase